MIKYLSVSILLSLMVFPDFARSKEKIDAKTAKSVEKMTLSLNESHQNRFSVNADFEKPVKGHFKLKSRKEFSKEFKSQGILSRFRNCSPDRITPADPRLFQVVFYGDTKSLNEVVQPGQLKVTVKITKEAKKRIAQDELRMPTLYVIHQYEDCGIKALPLQSNYDEVKGEVYGDFQTVGFTTPEFEKSAQAEFNVFVGYESTKQVDDEVTPLPRQTKIKMRSIASIKSEAKSKKSKTKKNNSYEFVY